MTHLKPQLVKQWLASCFLLVFPILPSMAETPDTDLALTESEQQWLQAQPIVIFTGDPNWLPYEAFDEEGNYIGIVAEHLKLIEEMTGLEFSMSPSTTWTESTLKAKQGLIHVLSETDDSDLKSHLNFTVPYLSNPIIIAMHNRENYVEGISSIMHKKIALIKDYGYTSKIRRKYSAIAFVTVDDIHDGLIAVSTGEIDALLCTLALCSYTIAELDLNNVRITGKTEFNTSLALGVQKDLPELLSILNKAISEISKEHSQLIRDYWIIDKFADKIDYTLLYRVVIIAIIIFFIFALWNRRLAHEITLRSITEKELKSAQEVLRLSHQRLSFHREHTPLGVIEWNTKFEVVDWNQAAENIFGFSKKEMQQPQATENILPKDAQEAINDVWGDLLKNKGGMRSRNENITKDGRTILCEWYNTPLVDPDGKVIGVASLVDDVTERTHSEQMVWKQANFDLLTGLPNRNMFHDRLAHEILRAERDRSTLALLLIDLDQFKEVNDTLGHDVGDELLKQTAHRISDCVRHSDTVARLGGDEFTVILPELNDNSNIEDITQKILQKLEEQFHLGDEIVHISGSIGITLYPNDASNIETLVKNADQAMYVAKKKGRNRFSYFTQSLQDAAQNRLKLTNDLRNALTKNQLEVYFQPIIDLETGHIVKAEALLRWHHPTRGMVSPIEFIHLAEETGMINKIGNWVFTQSVTKANQWGKQFNSGFQISVNMSPAQFRLDTSTFIMEWQAYLKELDISGHNIVVEITEGLLLHAEPDVIDKLLWLRDAGIQVAIDDFGTGYSSLSYLKKFDIDYLKIDKTFVSNLESNVNDIALCNAIIVMAHTLDLQVIAEGVETEGQKKILEEAGCDFVQGYLFSRPVAADEFEKILNATNK
ncbi:MAG: EAL domain-containing protein [Gammaproteobacteria bacterium]|nr:EAL domain-containing protein [Gammaproteobacteria bacterium]